MKTILQFVLIAGVYFIVHSCVSKKLNDPKSTVTERKEINAFMDKWHLCAANADTTFFEMMAPNGVYIGTDKSEIWHRDEFKEWAKPFFKRKKAWDFKPIKRNIYFSEDLKYAWFDEQLDTWMGVCQSSGVLKRKGKTWEIEHYQLSMTVPNDVTKDLIKLVEEHEKKQKKE